MNEELDESEPMGILADYEIKEHVFIDPFIETCPPGTISYGLSSYGYDLRIGRKFKIFSPVHSVAIDPKRVDPKAFVDIEVEPGKQFVLPPHGFALAESVESLVIPNNVLAICLGKSTYARAGLVVNITPLEPAWRGTVTIELSNTTPLPVIIYPGEGIAQVLFFAASKQCKRTYNDKAGKYQDQFGITLPMVK
jgi:dCTP deaminase